MAGEHMPRRPRILAEPVRRSRRAEDRARPQMLRRGMASEPALPARLRRSQHLSWFTHMGAVYLFHDLYGYLMEMSPDIADMIQSFDTGVDTQETIAYYRGRLGDADPRQF